MVVVVTIRTVRQADRQADRQTARQTTDRQTTDRRPGRTCEGGNEPGESGIKPLIY